jgi:putative heme-binding domain-containing protein
VPKVHSRPRKTAEFLGFSGPISGEMNGLLVEENEAAITLVRALGEKQRIERDAIGRVWASASSLMPAELEKAMTPQELADLIAFLKSNL